MAGINHSCRPKLLSGSIGLFQKDFWYYSRTMVLWESVWFLNESHCELWSSRHRTQALLDENISEEIVELMQITLFICLSQMCSCRSLADWHACAAAGGNTAYCLTWRQYHPYKLLMASGRAYWAQKKFKFTCWHVCILEQWSTWC